MVYEPSVRNSGIPDGKFLERGKYKNTDYNNNFFSPPDFMIGSVLKINCKLYIYCIQAGHSSFSSATNSPRNGTPITSNSSKKDNNSNNSENMKSKRKSKN